MGKLKPIEKLADDLNRGDVVILKGSPWILSRYLRRQICTI